MSVRRIPNRPGVKEITHICTPNVMAGSIRAAFGRPMSTLVYVELGRRVIYECFIPWHGVAPGERAPHLNYPERPA